MEVVSKNCHGGATKHEINQIQKELEEAKPSTSNNSVRYEIALDVLKEYHKKDRPFGNADFRGWCEKQLQP